MEAADVTETLSFVAGVVAFYYVWGDNIPRATFWMVLSMWLVK